MYKVKITNTDGLENSWMRKYKVGDIIEIADIWIHSWEKNMKILEHYKIITKSKKRCKHCGNWIIKREKERLDY